MKRKIKVYTHVTWWPVCHKIKQFFQFQIPFFIRLPINVMSDFQMLHKSKSYWNKYIWMYTYAYTGILIIYALVYKRFAYCHKNDFFV